MVGLCVDVLWTVVWLSVRTVGAVWKVEGDVQVVNNFHVCLYSYSKSMSLEASCYVFPYSFSLWSGCVFENGESVASIQTDVIFAVLFFCILLVFIDLSYLQELLQTKRLYTTIYIGVIVIYKK